MQYLDCFPKITRSYPCGACIRVELDEFSSYTFADRKDTGIGALCRIRKLSVAEESPSGCRIVRTYRNRSYLLLYLN